MNSVGQAYAVMKGRRQGNQEEAKGFLESMPSDQRKEQNRQESKARGSARPKKPYKLGERLKVRRG